ncbi:YbfB/YjiJ family MFS transporter [Neobacillus cucumis]|uniref:YbfB/YjiJ family MFS transporter n=1 Tax=Neobacillus cucumis TaxID=1740721 RepID=UPI00285371F7|nr:YbfB/YjiJ family MFS transporter [Neobacillus cucumis]MDR4949170.1 YbfB/YjiJ family MFS transporter [Neobacillus cucumis]
MNAVYENPHFENRTGKRTALFNIPDKRYDLNKIILLRFLFEEAIFSFFNRGNTVAGYIASSNYAGYLLGILAGAIPLKKYRVILLKISLIISILTTALMGLTYSHFLWYVLRFLSGVSSAKLKQRQNTHLAIK